MSYFLDTVELLDQYTRVNTLHQTN